jgi:hypothetical protein
MMGLISMEEGMFQRVRGGGLMLRCAHCKHFHTYIVQNNLKSLGEKRIETTEKKLITVISYRSWSFLAKRRAERGWNATSRRENARGFVSIMLFVRMRAVTPRLLFGALAYKYDVKMLKNLWSGAGSQE